MIKRTLLVVNLLFLCLIFAQPALAVTPGDILVVYNENMSGSKEVAQLYLDKRNVPPENTLGLKLPVSEKITRKIFDTELVPPIRNAVLKLKQSGKTPVILLVYGVPLIVDQYGGDEKEKYQKLVKEKIAELGDLVTNLTNRLNILVDGKTEEVPSTKDTPTIIKRAQAAILNTGKLQKKAILTTSVPESLLEVQSIIFRLVGISSVAKNIKQKAENKGISFEEAFKNDKLLMESFLIESQLVKISFRGVTQDNVQDFASMTRASRGLLGELNFLHKLKTLDRSGRSLAAVDSELSFILLDTYRKTDWLPNPFLKRFDTIPGIGQIRSETIKVARIDGPTPALAKKIITNSFFTEQVGLKGIFYIDARGRGVEKQGDYYEQYDKYLLNLYDIVKAKSSMPVVLDKEPGVFQKNSCPDAALYCGWYSHGKYVDSFEWKSGAVGFHAASSEATTLRAPDSQVWCKRMLEEGVAATLGPVREPYLNSFPRPDAFFPMLMTGKMPLIEVYYKTIPLLSWRQVLIGDPLYTPFKLQPAIEDGWENDFR